MFPVTVLAVATVTSCSSSESSMTPTSSIIQSCEYSRPFFSSALVSDKVLESTFFSSMFSITFSAVATVTSCSSSDSSIVPTSSIIQSCEYSRPLFSSTFGSETFVEALMIISSDFSGISFDNFPVASCSSSESSMAPTSSIIQSCEYSRPFFSSAVVSDKPLDATFFSSMFTITVSAVGTVTSCSSSESSITPTSSIIQSCEYSRTFFSSTLSDTFFVSTFNSSIFSITVFTVATVTSCSSSVSSIAPTSSIIQS